MINRRVFSIGAAISPSLVGCAGFDGTHVAPQTVSFENLIRQIKHDVGTYVFLNRDEPAPALGTACKGQVTLSIDKIKITVTTISERSAGLSGGLKVPINMVTVEAGAGASRALSDTLTTTLTIVPINATSDAVPDTPATARQLINKRPPPPSPDFEGTPISDALVRLRNDLLATSNIPPCFRFGAPDTQKENVVKWAFSVVDKAQGNGKFSLALFAVGAEGAVSKTYANTIEATFGADGEGFG